MTEREPWRGDVEGDDEEYLAEMQRLSHSIDETVEGLAKKLGLDASRLFNRHWILDENRSPVLAGLMVFGGPMDRAQWRYPTWAEAELGHARALDLVKKAYAEQDAAIEGATK